MALPASPETNDVESTVIEPSDPDDTAVETVVITVVEDVTVTVRETETKILRPLKRHCRKIKSQQVSRPITENTNLIYQFTLRIIEPRCYEC